MGFSTMAAGRGVRTCVVRVAVCVAVAGVSILPAQAHTDVAFSQDPLVVRNDRGGLLRDRLRQISTLRQQNRPVQIRGAVCLSTCTMFLGLPGTCVSPKTTFGFHGPSSYGRTLDPARFEYASQVISNYYPEPLRRWYMDTGRHSITSMYRIKGQTIIDMGIAAC